MPKVNPEDFSGETEKVRRGGKFDDEAPRSRGPSRKGTSGRRKAEPQGVATPVAKPPAERRSTMDGPKPPRPITVRSLQDLGSAVKQRHDQETDQAAAERAANTEPCPVCGQSKFKEVTFEDGGQKRTVPLLVCASCTGDYKAYRAGNLKANVELVRKNPNAPEPPPPPDKFHWVLQETTPDRFQARAQATQAAYRKKYDIVVTAVLQSRNYFEVEPHWEGVAKTRPVMRFSQAAYHSGMAFGVRESLETDPNHGLMTLRWAMKNAARCLETEHQNRVDQLRKELEARLAAPTAVKDQPEE